MDIAVHIASVIVQICVYMAVIRIGGWIYADHYKRKGVAEYLDRQAEDARWWKENPDGIKNHGNGFVEMRFKV